MERVPALEHLRLLLALGEEAEAARFVRSLCEETREAETLLAPVAATLLERNHHDLALQLARDALACDERCSRAHQVLVDGLAEMGDVASARAAAEQWVLVDPGCADAHVALSWALLADQDDEAAAEAAAQARDLDPDAAGGWLAMAYVSRLRNEWDRLAVYSLQALDRDPENRDARLFYGEALLAQGHAGAGIEVLRGLDDPRAHRALHRLRLRRVGSVAMIVVVAALATLGLTRASVGLVVGVAGGLLLADRGGLRTLAHPAVVWGAVGAAVLVVVRALL